MTKVLWSGMAIGLLCLVGASGSIAVAQSDPGIPDSVSIDSVVAYVSSGGCVVPIRFFNDEALQGVEVAFTFPQSLIKLDSFSFVGGRVEATAFHGVVMNNDSNMVSVYAAPSSPLISAGSGLLGRCYFSYVTTLTPQAIPIDSARWSPSTGVYHYSFFLAADSSSTEISPHFKNGVINIQPDPARPDSLWIATVQGAIGSEVAIDVNLYNAKPAKAAWLALNWNTNYLTLDSAAYVGTRSESAESKSIQVSPGLPELLLDLQYSDAIPLSAGTGVLTRLYFRIDPFCPETTIVVDPNVTVFAQNTSLQLTSADGNLQFVLKSTAGAVEVHAATAVDPNANANLPKAFALNQNFPNPFNPSTEIEFALPHAARVSIDVYDLLGRTVRRLVDQQMTAGLHRVTFDGHSANGEPLATGVYFYRMVTSDFTMSRKMLLLK